MADLEHAKAVTRMQDYIDSHLKEPITLRALAAEAGYSPWHSAKMFKEYTGKAPFEYIRMLRLSKAALILRDEKRKIVDVAMDFVFDTHEGFTRAFKKQFGVQPKIYQKNTPPIQLFTPYPVQEYYQMGQKKCNLPPLSKNFHVHIMNFPKRKLILKRAQVADNYFDYVNEVGCDVWGMLTSVKEALYEPVGMWLPDKFRPPATSIYVQGVEVPDDYSGSIPDGYEMIDLPACTMMMFQGNPYDEDRFDEAIVELSRIINDYDPMPNGYTWADSDAPRIQLEPEGYRGYIEARPVKSII